MGKKVVRRAWSEESTKISPAKSKEGEKQWGEGEPKRAHDATPHPAIVNESTMSRIMHNELFRVDALMRRTMMRARTPEHPAKGRWRPRESSLFPLSSNLFFSDTTIRTRLSYQAGIDYFTLNVSARLNKYNGYS